MKKQWFETWFDSPYYHLLYKNRDNQEAAEFIDTLLSYLNPQDGQSFLDLACGKGRHSVYLSSKGYRVDGADYSSNNVEEAKHSESKGLRFFKHDMREPLPYDRYDYIVNLFTSFGYFKTDEEHLKTLENVYFALNKGGVFVLDFLNIDWVSDHFHRNEERELDGLKFIIRKSIRSGYINKSIKFDYEGETIEYKEKVRAFNMEGLCQLMENAGFKIKDIFGNYKLHDFDKHSSDRLIIIGEK